MIITKKNIIISVAYLLISGLFIINTANSAPVSTANGVTVDIYGTKDLSANVIRRKFRTEFAKIAEIIKTPNGIHSSDNNKLLDDLLLKITQEIQLNKNFIFVKLSPIMYPGDNVVHFTIDIVDEKNKDRLSHFLPAPNKTIKDPDHLISSWMQYETMGFAIFNKEKQLPSYKTCPAHHCLFGFERKELRKFEKIFAQAEKDKSSLIAVLKNDKNEKKRAAAAFLLAHIKSENELINILIPSIYDSNSEVRNNAMRVIGFTILNTKEYTIPIEKITMALDFPETTDRNKALLIVLTLINKPAYANFVLAHSSQELFDELKLKQPNNHNLSYMILKKLSGKNYSEHDYRSWKKWLKLT